MPTMQASSRAAQLHAVFTAMRDGAWHTLEDLAAAVGAPTQSVSARLRDFRKDAYGAHTVERCATQTRGLFVYRLRRRARR